MNGNRRGGRKWKWLAIGLCAAIGAGAASAVPRRTSELRLDPHLYASARGTEPTQQLVALVQQGWQSSAPEAWALAFHWEVEAQGRHDFSLDLDRAWYRVAVTPRASLFLGRIHPWDIADYPAADRPWGLMAHRQSQNRGLLLGYGLDPLSPEPRPILLGWIGAQFRYGGDSPLQLTFSASPIFLPDVGPDLTLAPTVSAARFARRPPGYVDLNGHQVPLSLSVDSARLWQDVILRPQIMGTARYRWSRADESWIVLSRAPSPAPDFRTDGYLQVTASSIQAVAHVQPYFSERWDLALTQSRRFADLPWAPSLEATAFASDDETWGAELAARSAYLDLSVLQARRWGPASGIVTSEASYTDWLAQAEAHLQLARWLIHAGAMSHPGQRDLWLHGGVRWALDRDSSIDIGGDWFQGGDDSYFGEWRTNSRVSVALQWGIGS